MSIEKLQERIRRTKNPSVLNLSLTDSQIPKPILDQQPTFSSACREYAVQLMNALKGTVPAVRFSYSHYALMGTDGLKVLQELLQEGKKCGYYVLLDGVEGASLPLTEYAAQVLCEIECDSLIVPSYAGGDVIIPYTKRLNQSKSLFVILRSANRSASQLQDLMVGSRLVHMAAADIANRLGSDAVGKSGYSRVGGVASATSADSLRTLRSKYPNLFLLVDGYDYSNSNAKNCSYAFDKLGHGAIVCAGETITSAWKDSLQADYLAAAMTAAERMRKNLTRYVTIL